jgi:hypothetical protein
MISGTLKLCQLMYVNILSIIKNRINVGMVSLLDFSVVDLWFYPQSGQSIKLVFAASPLSMQH